MYGTRSPYNAIKPLYLNIRPSDVEAYRRREQQRHRYNPEEGIPQLEREYKLTSTILRGDVDLLNCKGVDLEKVGDRLGSVDLIGLGKQSSLNFYDGTLMEISACVLRAIWNSSKSNELLVSNSVRVQLFLIELTRIGASSLEGVAMSARYPLPKDLLGSLYYRGLPAPNKPFVIKYAVLPTIRKINGVDKDLSMVHETMVGLVMNTMRKYGVINFAYVYGSFQCGPAIFKGLVADATRNSENVITWCNETAGQNPVSYLLYENVYPSLSLADYIRTCTLKQWLVVYLQALYALNAAKERFGFTHWDLHSFNVLVRQVEGKNQFSLPYTTENGLEFMKCDRVTTIIDYGQSRVQWKGVNYGALNLSVYGNVPNNPNPSTDALKLLGHSYGTAIRYGNTLLARGLLPLFDFFTSDYDKAYFIDKMGRDLLWTVPAVPPYINFDLLKYAQMVRSTYTNELMGVFSNSPNINAPTLGCFGAGSDISCLNTPEKAFSFMKSVGISGDLKSPNLFEFYDSYAKLFSSPSSSSKSEAIALLNAFDYDTAVKENNEKLVRLYKDFIAYRNGVSLLGQPSISIPYIRRLTDISLSAFYTNRLIKLEVEISYAVADMKKKEWTLPITDQDKLDYYNALFVLNANVKYLVDVDKDFKRRPPFRQNEMAWYKGGFTNSLKILTS